MDWIEARQEGLRLASGEDDEDENNDYFPFASEMDWEVASWAKLNGITATAFTNLLKINTGKVRSLYYLHQCS